MTGRKVVVIGAGFSGLSAACFLAKAGCEVVMLEKNSTIGGRARKFEAAGFTFDMGPSWYWMPDVFERFFNQFGKTTADFYQLDRLTPSYRVYYGKADYWDIPSNINDMYALFEKEEKGSAARLRQFLEEAEFKYKAGIGKFVHLPGKSIFEYFDGEVLNAVFKMHLLTDMASYVRKYFKSPKIISLLEFPVLFLGETPGRTPALYSLMNYADMKLGTWYPQGGMFKIIEAMEQIAISLGVKIHTNAEVTHIDIQENNAKKVYSNAGDFSCDAVVGSADYHHLDSHVLPQKYRQYSPQYWASRKMAPSSLLYYLGVNKPLPNLLHHNLFFDTDFGKHAFEIYDKPQWPSKPLFYVSVPSKTDPTIAPLGQENVFILIPTAPGLIDTGDVQEKYFNIVLERLEQVAGVSFRENIVYRRDYAARNFIADYHAHKGNAYGLANTLLQTGPLKPAMHHRQVKNLLFTGQLTVPGPGVPPSIISGEVVAKELMKLIG